MANTILTHQMIAREAAKLLEEHSPFLANINKGRQDEFGEAVGGYKKGDTVKIEVPQSGVVFNGAVFAEGGSATEIKQRHVNLTLDTQKHIGLRFGTKERVLDIAEFKERILRPQMATLSSVVEADLIKKAVLATPNYVGTPGTVPSSMKTFAQARSALNRFLAPATDRFTLISSEINVELTDEARKLFNPSKESSKAFLEGSLGHAMGADFYEHQSIPELANGAAATVTVNGANQTGKTLTIAATTPGIAKGQVFTIAGVFSVHPLTGVSTGKLQQFVAVEDAASTSLQVFPEIITSGPGKTVSAAPANGAALTFAGAASTSYRESLMIHKNAFTVATAPLPVIAGCEGYTARLPNGLSVRVMTGGDFTNDAENTRIDILYGSTMVDGRHACRVFE